MAAAIFMPIAFQAASVEPVTSWLPAEASPSFRVIRRITPPSAPTTPAPPPALIWVPTRATPIRVSPPAIKFTSMGAPGFRPAFIRCCPRATRFSPARFSSRRKAACPPPRESPSRTGPAPWPATGLTIHLISRVELAPCEPRSRWLRRRSCAPAPNTTTFPAIRS